MNEDRLDYYRAAEQAYRAAAQAYRAACTAYRNREIDDETYLVHRAAWKENQRAFDAELARVDGDDN